MMTSLFSMFDPSNSFFISNWMMILIPMMIIPSKSIKTTKSLVCVMIPLKTLEKEMEIAFKTIKTQESTKLMVLMFAFVAILNAWSLIPSTFGPTAQISVNLPLAISAWVSAIAFSTTKKTKNMMAHLVPSGTPYVLMPLMVMIELTSNIIRPITLSVRLTANMIAGHIMISLAEEFIQSGSSPIPVSIMSISILTILESGVALIQAYIFTTLVSMYLSENH